MRTAGLAIGGNLNNAIVVDKYKILNPEGLRLEKEFVKHKTLDCIGDFYLLGMQLVGNIECFAKCIGYPNGILTFPPWHLAR